MDDINETTLSEQMKCSIRLGSALWSLDATCWSDEAVGVKGHRALPGSESTSRQMQPKVKTNLQFRERVYAQLYAKSADAWFERLMQERIVPNPEQLTY